MAQTPAMRLTRSGGSLTVKWIPSGGVLQSVEALGSPTNHWIDVGPINPFTEVIGPRSKFYRVKPTSTSISTQAVIRYSSAAGGSVNASDFGTAGDGVTDDTAALQAGLDWVAEGGGGVFFIPPGTYIVTNTLLIGNGTQVSGAGRGVTTIKERTVAGRLGRVVQGAQAYATFAMVGVTNAAVRSLTVDHRSSTNAMNGIVLMPTGSQLTGSVSIGCTIEDCEVLGHPGHHAYLIWCMRGERAHILNNFCDGGTTSDSESFVGEEGIEVFGGREVWIVGNHIKGIANRALNIGSSTGNDKVDVDTVWVENNYVSTSKIGAYINTSFDPVFHVQNTQNVKLLNNHFEKLWLYGIQVFLSENTTLNNLTISGNTISNVVGPGCEGIDLFGYGASQGAPIGIQAVTVDHNTIVAVTNLTTTTSPIHVGFWKNTVIEKNYIDGGNHQGLEVMFFSTNVTVRANSIVNSWGSAIYFDHSSECSITDNQLLGYNQSTIGYSGMMFVTCSNLWITGNQFQFNSAAPETLPVVTSSDCDRLAIFNNPLLYKATIPMPLYNIGNNPSMGTFKVAEGLSTCAITNTLVSQISSVSVRQTSGTIIPGLSVNKGFPIPGSFSVQFYSATTGNESFTYELAP